MGTRNGSGGEWQIGEGREEEEEERGGKGGSGGARVEGEGKRE